MYSIYVEACYILEFKRIVKPRSSTSRYIDWEIQRDLQTTAREMSLPRAESNFTRLVFLPTPVLFGGFDNTLCGRVEGREDCRQFEGSRTRSHLLVASPHESIWLSDLPLMICLGHCLVEQLVGPTIGLFQRQTEMLVVDSTQEPWI